MTQVVAPPRQLPQDEPPSDRPTLQRRPFLIALLAVVMLFVVLIAPRVSLEPGDSHDGRNAGLWTVGGRSLLENGPIESRLGAWAPEREVYANHPPGVTWETAAFLATTGTSPWSRKAPAYVSSIVAIGLAAVLLRRLGFSRAASLGGVAVMATTPMMLIFGASPNMEAASLPWVFLVLIAWADPDHPHARLAAGVGVIGCVWMFHGSLLLAAGLGAMSLLRLLRGRETAIDRRVVVCALPAGLLLGAWFAWANGGLSGLLAQGGTRSTLGDIGATDWLDRQGRYLGDVFGWPLLLLVVAGLVVAIRSTSGHQRMTVAIAAAAPVAYLAVTVDGAWHHEYWNYLFLVPIAVGSAGLIDAAKPFDSPLRRWAPPTLVALRI